MKIILILFAAILFSSTSYTLAQQVKPAPTKPATTAAPKVTAKPVQKTLPKTGTQKPKVKPKVKPKTIVDTTATKTGHKQVKTEIGVTGISNNYGACAIVTLKNATMAFFPANGENVENPKKVKKQFVRIEIDMLSTCDEPYSYNYAACHMLCSDGTLALTSIHLDATTVPDQKTAIHELAKGQTLSTALYFEVPDTETLNTLTFVVNGYDAKGLTTMLELKLGK